MRIETTGEDRRICIPEFGDVLPNGATVVQAVPDLRENGPAEEGFLLARLPGPRGHLWVTWRYYFADNSTGFTCLTTTGDYCYLLEQAVDSLKDRANLAQV